MSYTNEDIFCAVRDGDLEKVRRMVKDGVELSQVPEREVIRSSRGYVFETALCRQGVHRLLSTCLSITAML